MVEKIGRAELADGGGRKALGAGHLQDGFFVQIVAVEMLVDVAEHGVVLDEGNDGVAGRHGRIAGIDRVAEGAGVAEVMAARHRRTVRHGEGRKQRMRVLEVDALVANFGHRRRGLRRHDAPAQTVRHEQDQVARRGVLRRRGIADAYRLADSNTIVRRITFSPDRSHSGGPPVPRFSFALRQNCYIERNRPQEWGAEERTASDRSPGGVERAAIKP